MRPTAIRDCAGRKEDEAMKTTYIRVAVLATVVTAITAVAGALTVPVMDSTYNLMDDMLTFNWRILAQKYPSTVEVPALPTGNNVAPFLRIFSNGNTNSPLLPPVKWQDDSVGGPYGDFNAAQSASLWYGLEYEKGQEQNPDTVARVLTGGEILNLIQNINPGSTSPIFAFDQNQTPNDSLNSPLPSGWGTTPALARDIWIRGRIILVKPDAVGGLGSLIGLTAQGVNNIIDPLIAANDPGVVVFNLSDTIFGDFPGSPNWVYLPGNYQIEGFTADNNGAGNNGDWGGFCPGLDLTQYTNYGMFVELQTLFDNDGQEEVYIVGGIGGETPPVIPEPVTLLGVFVGIAGLAGYIRKRKPV